MAIITVANNTDMLTLSNLWNFSQWPVPPVDNLDGTWTVPDDYADSITNALADMAGTQAKIDEGAVLASSGSLASSVADLANNKDAFIRDCLNGTVNATNGANKVLGDGTAIYVVAPVPDLLGATATVVLQNIPAFTSPISLRGMVQAQGGTEWWGIGDGRNGSTNTIAASITTNNTEITLTGNNSDWQQSGYIAFHYIP